MVDGAAESAAAWPGRAAGRLATVLAVGVRTEFLKDVPEAIEWINQEKARGCTDEAIDAELWRSRSTALAEILVEEVKALRTRVGQLEATTLTYSGHYSAMDAYTKNTLITHAGVWWVSLRAIEVGERPGEGPLGNPWLMIQKSHASNSARRAA
jgi:hypothetical protein